MMIAALEFDLDINVWQPPDDKVDACELPKVFMPLQFRRKNQATCRKVFLRFVNDNHFVLLKPDPPNQTVRVGIAVNVHHYFNGNRDVATGLCVLFPILVCRPAAKLAGHRI